MTSIDIVTKPLITSVDKLPRANMRKVFLSQLRLNADPFRFWADGHNWETVLEFAQTILQKKVVDDPIEVFPTTFSKDGIFDVEDGDTRTLAVALLEGKNLLTGETVPAQVEPDTIPIFAIVSDEKNPINRMFRRLVAMSGRGLTDLEWAAAIDRLRHQQAVDPETGKPVFDAGGDPKMLNNAQIAERLGWQETRVGRIYRLHLVPEGLKGLMRTGQVMTTSVLDTIDDHGEEAAQAIILEVVKTGKEQAQVVHEQAQRDLEVAQARLATAQAEMTAEGDEQRRPGRQPLSEVEAAQREVQKAAERVEAAAKEMEQGPARITAREIKAQAAATPRAAKAPAAIGTKTNTKARISKTGYAALLDGVRHAARESMEPAIRNAMNKALESAGHEPVRPLVDDKGERLPVEGEVVAEDTTTGASA